jgi:excisionase family DNA binding protein
MQTTNPFEIILSRLDELQLSINSMSAREAKQSTKTDPERLLDLTEAAQMVRKPVGTVRHYIHHRSLPATKIGKSYLIKLSELLSWVDEFNKKPETEDLASNRMFEIVRGTENLESMATANKKLEHIRLEKYLTDNFHFRLNEITGSIEFKKKCDAEWMN